MMKVQAMLQYSSLSDGTLFGVQQSLRSRSARYLPGGVELWRALGRVLVLAVPMVLAVSLLLGTVGDKFERAIAAGEAQHQQLFDKNIELLAHRAGIYNPDRVSRLAAERLSLYAAAPGQIERIN